MNNKIKVLHIIPSIGKGGAERVAVNLCNELSIRENIEVKLIYFYPYNEYEHLLNDKLTHFINCNVSLSVIKKNIKQIEEFDNLINEFKPDIIHSHLYEAEILSRYKLHDCIYVSHLHSFRKQFVLPKFKDLFYKEKLTQLYERSFLIKRYRRCNNKFIAVSNQVRDFYIKHLPNKLNNIFLLFNPINFNDFYCSKKNILNKNKIKLISVGSLRKLKNHVFLVDIVHELIKRNIDVELLILGEGKEREAIQSKIDKYNLKDKIKLVGNVVKPEDYYKNADIYVHSSTSESFGLSILEAMASGLPCITLDAKGNRDIIKDGINGYMIYKQEIDVFCDKIQTLVNNEELYIKMSNNAIEFARDFDIKIYIDKLVDYYINLLKNKKK